ncbi:MAG: type II toxin-antitoxin system Phd/YefM family antitoxin [Acidobacteriota bacterium]
MEAVAISKFKATCLALLDRVRKTGQPILITKRGEPIAQVVPPPPPESPGKSTFGSMADTVEIVGDIVEPVGVEDWEALQ